MDTKMIELIDKYLNSELSEKDLIEFEKQVKSDPELAKELELHREINMALQEKDVMKLRDQLKAIHLKAIASESSGRVIPFFSRNRYTVAAIAASLLILITIGGLLFFGRPVSNQQLYSKYYSPVEAVTIVRSGEAVTGITIKEALLAYHESNYEEAIALFSKEPENLLAKFYLSLSYIETGKINEAIRLLDEIIKHRDNLFVEQAEWYLGLAYLKVDNSDKAREMFGKISKSTSIYRIKASQILKKL